MKNIKRILVVFLAVAMLLPMAITTSFAADTAVTDEWTLLAGKYLAGGLFAKRAAKGYTVTANADGSISIYSPTYSEYGARSDTQVQSNVAVITNRNVTPLDYLTATLKPGAGFTFNRDSKGTSDSLVFLWTLGHPITLSEILADPDGKYTNIPFALDLNEILGDGLRGLVRNAYTDSETGELVQGDKGLGVMVDNPDGNNTVTYTASRAMIYKFDGEFIDANNGKYGYRWSFCARNFTPMTPNGDDTGIYSFDERIETQEGVTFEVIPDTTLGYKVYINGKDFSNGREVGYFPDNTRFSNDDVIAKNKNYIDSMTYARADIDLNALVGLGNGYLTLGTTGQISNRTGYTVDVVAVNGMPAAEWMGEANDAAHTHSWTRIVNVAPSCYVPGTHIFKCECGAVKNTQFITTVEQNPEITVQNELRALEALFDAQGISRQSDDFIKARNEILMKVYYKTTDALEHEYTYRTILEPTCTTMGIREKICAHNCGLEATQEATPKLGHNWTNWQFDSDGNLTRSCQRCEEVETANVPTDYTEAWNISAINYLNVFKEDKTDVSDNDQFSASEDSETGAITILDSAAAYGTQLKLPITKAITKVSSKLDGFSANVTNIPGDLDGFPLNNYSMSFLWTNNYENYYLAGQYSTYQRSTLTQARFGQLWEHYDGGEYDICVTLLDNLVVDNNNDGITGQGDMDVGTYGDGIYDAVTVGVVVDGQGRSFEHAEIAVPMDEAVNVALAYDPETQELTITFNELDPVVFDVGPQLTTDAYYFSVASIGLTPDDYTTGAYNLTETATLSSASFTINSVCGEAANTFFGIGHTPYEEEHVHVPAEEWVVTKEATCTEDGESTLYCSTCGEVLQTEVIPALGHNWGEWVVTKEATINERGEETRTCSRCFEIETREIPKLGVDYEVKNYDFIINNAVLPDGAYVNTMRIAPGEWNTSNDIRNAPGMVTVSEALCKANTDENGKLTYNFISAGMYSIWVRYKNTDGSTFTFILGGGFEKPQADYPSIVLDNFTPSVGKINGLTVTVDNIWIDSAKGFRDFFLARGQWETYNDCKASNNQIVRVQASNVQTQNNNYGRSYKYEMSYKNASDDGWYTIWFRTNDGKGWAEQFQVKYPQPKITDNGLQATVTDLIDTSGEEDLHTNVKTVRVAPGEWADASAVKKAPGVRVFQAKTILKNKTEYTVQFRTDGWYTFSIEYDGGYTVVEKIYIAHLAPTVTVNADNTVTFDKLDQLYIIRYAPNPKNSTDWSQGFFKRADGNRYAKTADLVDGKFTTAVLPEIVFTKNGVAQTCNIWSFMVQYNEESYNILTVNFDDGSVTWLKP